LAAEQSSKHAPTLELLAALRAGQWRVKWNAGGRAVLVHRDLGTMEVQVNLNDHDRLIVLVDGREVPHRIAMDRAEGVA
jgi:hypothetical protein